MMKLSDKQKTYVDTMMRVKKTRADGEITILTEDTKFKVGDVALLVMNEWEEYFVKPKQVVILEVYSHMKSVYGDRPELYMIEIAEEEKMDCGLRPGQLLRKENTYGY